LLALPLPGATRGFCGAAVAFLVAFGGLGSATGVAASVLACSSAFDGMVKSPLAVCAPVTFITPLRCKGKVDLPDFGRNVSVERNRALESSGRAWR